MPTPKESLGDLLSNIPSSELSGAPTLRSAQETRQIKPLTSYDHLEPALEIKAAHVDNPMVAGTVPVPFKLSAFRRELFLSGAVTMSAMVFVIAIYLGFVGSAGRTDDSKDDLSPIRQAEKTRRPPKVTIPLGIRSSRRSTEISGELAVEKTVARTSFKWPKIVRAAHRPQPAKRQPFRPRSVVAKFIPTTLVIYVEHGKIKTRIEPQLTAAYRKPSTVPN